MGSAAARSVWRRCALALLALPVGGGRPRRRDMGTQRPTSVPWPRGRRPRVLVVRPDHLGDLLLTTPALGLLRAALPEAEITALVGPWAQPVLAGRTEVDRVATCAFPGFTRGTPGLPLAPYARLVWEGLRLRRARYDAALVLRVDHWWGAALVAYGGIPLRLGYAVPESRAFLTHALRADFAQHSVLESWRLVGALLGLLGRRVPAGAPPAVRATASPAGRAAAAAFLAAQGVALDQPLVAIHPGTGADVKRWPAARWAQVADALVAERGARVIVTGSAEEREVVGAVVAAMERPAVAAAGSLDWDALGGLFARCAIVLGVDSGPLHLAAALGVPTTHVFGPTDPRRFGPWGSAPLHRVIRVPLACSPCGNLIAPPCGERAEPACMRGVAPAAVLKAATEALDAAAVIGTASVAGLGA